MCVLQIITKFHTQSGTLVHRTRTRYKFLATFFQKSGTLVHRTRTRYKFLATFFQLIMGCNYYIIWLHFIMVWYLDLSVNHGFIVASIKINCGLAPSGRGPAISKNRALQPRPYSVSMEVPPPRGSSQLGHGEIAGYTIKFIDLKLHVCRWLYFWH